MLVPQHFLVDHTGYFGGKKLPIDNEYCHFPIPIFHFFVLNMEMHKSKSSLCLNDPVFEKYRKENYPIDHKSFLRERISLPVTFVRTS